MATDPNSLDFVYPTVEHGHTEMIFYMSARRNGFSSEQAAEATVAFVNDAMSNWHNPGWPTRGELFDSLERVMRPYSEEIPS